MRRSSRRTSHRSVAPVAAGLAAAGVTAAALRWWRTGPVPDRWRRALQRTNHAGRPVTLWEGPAVGVGALTGLVAGGLIGGRGLLPGAVAAAGGLAAGAYDDLVGTGQAKGLRGHLTALRSGRVTSGMVKVLVVGASAAVAAALPAGAAGDDGRVRRLAGIAADAVTIAGTANVVNLLDLRPGRALKAVGLVCLPLTFGSSAGSSASAATLGAAIAALPGDLAGTSMLGDTGANALGALAGTALTRGVRRSLLARGLAATVVTALNLASERVSFTELIERTSWLRAVDTAGRRG